GHQTSLIKISTDHHQNDLRSSLLLKLSKLLSDSAATLITLIFANITLNLSKSLRDALLFWTISFLPHELFSHLFFTSLPPLP
ncbi:Os04g0515350, partial [Oryza sativa Japonica Group]